MPPPPQLKHEDEAVREVAASALANLMLHEHVALSLLQQGIHQVPKKKTERRRKKKKKKKKKVRRRRRRRRKKKNIRMKSECVIST